MTLDAEKIIEFPDFETWAELYAKLKDSLVKRLNSSYSLADREDAVEEAFHKLSEPSAGRPVATFPT